MTSNTEIIFSVTAEAIVSVIESVVLICVVMTHAQVEIVTPSPAEPSESVYSASFDHEFVEPEALSATLECLLETPSETAVESLSVTQLTITSLPTVRFAFGLTETLVSLADSVVEPRAVTPENAISS